MHNDESTPHLVAYVVPLDERGKLNAKKWLGGKKLMNEMQK
ncbi:plasmid recombination protein [Actinobacillus pleuropneumoniae]